VTELYRYRDLVRTLVARDLKVRYRRSAIGFLWTMLHPLMMMLVLSLIFAEIFKMQGQIEHFAVYALAGIVFWNFFSQSIVASMNSLRGNAGLLTKLPVPKSVFPIATVLSGLVNLLFAMLPLFASMIGTGLTPTPALLFLPVAMVIAAVFTLGMGLLLAPLAAFFSDTVELVSILLTLFMYLTPVFYPIAIVPERLRWIIELNPTYTILTIFRVPIHDGVLPEMTQVLVAAGLAIVAFVTGALMFRRSADQIAFYV
jgi:ABC-2 type transport system permease protein